MEKNSKTESIKSQFNERMRSEESTRFEERNCELERRIKQKAEAAVAAHKPSEDETAAGMKQAEGCADANAAAPHNLVEEETAEATKDTEGETKTDSAVAATEYKREEVNSTESTREKSEAAVSEKTTNIKTTRSWRSSNKGEKLRKKTSNN